MPCMIAPMPCDFCVDIKAKTDRGREIDHHAQAYAHYDPKEAHL